MRGSEGSLASAAGTNSSCRRYIEACLSICVTYTRIVIKFSATSAIGSFVVCPVWRKSGVEGRRANRYHLLMYLRRLYSITWIASLVAGANPTGGTSLTTRAKAEETHSLEVLPSHQNVRDQYLLTLNAECAALIDACEDNMLIHNSSVSVTAVSCKKATARRALCTFRASISANAPMECTARMRLERGAIGRSLWTADLSPHDRTTRRDAVSCRQ